MAIYRVVALDTGEPVMEDTVEIYYWWPGCNMDVTMMPEKFQSLVRRCKRANSRYLAYATVYVPGIGELYGYARCMDIDNPSRKFARDKAVGWLTKRLLDHGMTVEMVG